MGAASSSLESTFLLRPSDAPFCGSCAENRNLEGDVSADADAPVTYLSDEKMQANSMRRYSSEEPSQHRTSRRSGVARTSCSSRKSDRFDAVASVDQLHTVTSENHSLTALDSGNDGELSIPKKVNSLVLIPTIRRQIGNFRARMEEEHGPNPVEEARGVQLQRTYDFYDSKARKIRVRKMFDDVLHHRKEDEDMFSPRASSSSSSTTRTPSDDSMAMCRAPIDGAEMDGPAKSHKKGTRSAKVGKGDILTTQERVTFWGVLAGGLLHRVFAPLDSLYNPSLRRLAQGHHKGDLPTATSSRARVVVQRAEALAHEVLEDKRDVYDALWGWEEDAKLLKHLFDEEYLDTLSLLGSAARRTVERQPVLIDVEAPVRIFGDLHGQLRDMLFLFGAFGLPSRSDGPSFIFNGDFVDRGKHQISTLGILLALKVAMPDKIWLIRGNHEDKSMNERYGFRDECLRVLGPKTGAQVYEVFHKVFDQLPVAALVSDKILVLHGGIGDGTWTLKDLRGIRRPLGTNDLANPVNKWIHSLLWSDPIPEDDDSLRGVFGVHASPRGHVGLCFAWDLTRQFCARNGLGLIVRSHQSKQGSLGFDIMHDNMLVRVFSARDYEEHGNDGAVLLVQSQRNMLKVRPQVLRSVTKATDEAIMRKMSISASMTNLDMVSDPGEKKVKSRREVLALMRASTRRQAIFRRARTKACLEDAKPAFKGWLWRLKEDGKSKKDSDWFWEEFSFSRNGGLTTSGDKDKDKEIVLIPPANLATLHLLRAQQQGSRPFAFQIIFQKENSELSKLMLAAESGQMRMRWMAELNRGSGSGS